MSWLSNWWNDASGKNAQRETRAAQQRAQAQQQALLNQQKQIAQQQQVVQQRQVQDQVQQQAPAPGPILKPAEQPKPIDYSQSNRATIDSVFAQFDDPYFQGLAKRYTGANTPRIDEQYKLAQDSKIGDLAERGILRSTVGANSLAQLAKTAADERAKVANEGQDFSNTQRANVNAAKNNLYSTNLAVTDPSQLAAQATGSATTLVNGVTTTPAPAISNAFGAFLTPVGNALLANQNGLAPGWKSTGGVNPNTASGNGSSQVTA